MNASHPFRAQRAANDAIASAPVHAQLERACRALWVATLGLMSAYVQAEPGAPRTQLAARIARNFVLLQQQSPAFAPRCRDHFERLASKWSAMSARTH